MIMHDNKRKHTIKEYEIVESNVESLNGFIWTSTR